MRVKTHIEIYMLVAIIDKFRRYLSGYYYKSTSNVKYVSFVLDS